MRRGAPATIRFVNTIENDTKRKHFGRPPAIEFKGAADSSEKPTDFAVSLKDLAFLWIEKKITTNSIKRALEGVCFIVDMLFSPSSLTLEQARLSNHTF